MKRQHGNLKPSNVGLFPSNVLYEYYNALLMDYGPSAELRPGNPIFAPGGWQTTPSAHDTDPCPICFAIALYKIHPVDELMYRRLIQIFTPPNKLSYCPSHRQYSSDGGKKRKHNSRLTAPFFSDQDLKYLKSDTEALTETFKLLTPPPELSGLLDDIRSLTALPLSPPSPSLSGLVGQAARTFLWVVTPLDRLMMSLTKNHLFPGGQVMCLVLSMVTTLPSFLSTLLVDAKSRGEEVPEIDQLDAITVGDTPDHIFDGWITTLEDELSSTFLHSADTSIIYDLVDAIESSAYISAYEGCKYMDMWICQLLETPSNDTSTDLSRLLTSIFTALPSVPSTQSICPVTKLELVGPFVCQLLSLLRLFSLDVAVAKEIPTKPKDVEETGIHAGEDRDKYRLLLFTFSAVISKLVPLVTTKEWISIVLPFILSEVSTSSQLIPGLTETALECYGRLLVELVFIKPLTQFEEDPNACPLTVWKDMEAYIEGIDLNYKIFTHLISTHCGGFPSTREACLVALEELAANESVFLASVPHRVLKKLITSDDLNTRMVLEFRASTLRRDRGAERSSLFRDIHEESFTIELVALSACPFYREASKEGVSFLFELVLTAMHQLSITRVLPQDNEWRDLLTAPLVLESPLKPSSTFIHVLIQHQISRKADGDDVTILTLVTDVLNCVFLHKVPRVPLISLPTISEVEASSCRLQGQSGNLTALIEEVTRQVLSIAEDRSKEGSELMGRRAAKSAPVSFAPPDHVSLDDSLMVSDWLSPWFESLSTQSRLSTPEEVRLMNAILTLLPLLNVGTHQKLNFLSSLKDADPTCLTLTPRVFPLLTSDWGLRSPDVHVNALAVNLIYNLLTHGVQPDDDTAMDCVHNLTVILFRVNQNYTQEWRSSVLNPPAVWYQRLTITEVEEPPTISPDLVGFTLSKLLAVVDSYELEKTLTLDLTFWISLAELLSDRSCTPAGSSLSRSVVSWLKEGSIQYTQLAIRLILSKFPKMNPFMNCNPKSPLVMSLESRLLAPQQLVPNGNWPQMRSESSKAKCNQCTYPIDSPADGHWARSCLRTRGFEPANPPPQRVLDGKSEPILSPLILGQGCWISTRIDSSSTDFHFVAIPCKKLANRAVSRSSVFSSFRINTDDDHESHVCTLEGTLRLENNNGVTAFGDTSLHPNTDVIDDTYPLHTLRVRGESWWELKQVASKSFRKLRAYDSLSEYRSSRIQLPIASLHHFKPLQRDAQIAHRRLSIIRHMHQLMNPSILCSL
eukprot:GHVH01015696.1.p1 GENE.GHVH01015696.1~~GHVH01015696.1.p1  ORF type:complete len:1255 (-),score=185.90 GHVH01015696.1:927-4691(-)